MCIEGRIVGDTRTEFTLLHPRLEIEYAKLLGQDFSSDFMLDENDFY